MATENAEDYAAAAEADGGGAPVVVVHDPQHDDISAQTAQAIAASAAAYNLPAMAAINNNQHGGMHADYPANDAAAGYLDAVGVDLRNHHHYYHHHHAAHTDAAGVELEHQQQQQQQQQQQENEHQHTAAAAAAGMGIEYMAAAAVTAAEAQQPQAAAAAMATEGGYTDTMYAENNAGYAYANFDEQAAVQHAAYAHDQYAHDQAVMHDETTGLESMDHLLAQQKMAIDEVEAAERDLELAKERLERARASKLAIDERISSHAESSVDELLAQPSKWNEMYALLVEYRNEFGHCHVMRQPVKKKRGGQRPTRREVRLQSLGTWVGQVRKDARRPPGDPNRLEPYKIAALNRLGFDWEPRENYWNDMYNQLREYLAESGGRMPPRVVNGEKFPLGQWCDTQLDNYRKLRSGKRGAYITQEKIDLLNGIGFIWDKRGQLWRDNYDRLVRFKAEHGHCNATTANNGGDKTLGAWVAKQKRKYACWRRGENLHSQELSLTDEQAALMDEIGFGEFVERGAGGGMLSKRAREDEAQPPDDTARARFEAANETEEGVAVQEPQHEQDEDAGADGNDLRQRGAAFEGYSNSANAATMANMWGDSANAVSLLVNAMINKESQGAPS